MHLIFIVVLIFSPQFEIMHSLNRNIIPSKISTPSKKVKFQPAITKPTAAPHHCTQLTEIKSKTNGIHATVKLLDARKCIDNFISEAKFDYRNKS